MPGPLLSLLLTGVALICRLPYSLAAALEFEGGAGLEYDGAADQLVMNRNLVAAGIDVSAMASTVATLNTYVFPEGGIIMWAGLHSDVPAGWALCDGTGQTTNMGFPVPDLRDRFIVGAGSTYSRGDTGGTSSVTLQTSQLPSHSHSVLQTPHTHPFTDHGHTHFINDPGHTHSITVVPHSHNVPSSQHSHSVLDNGHSHSILDTGHTHQIPTKAGTGCSDASSASTYNTCSDPSSLTSFGKSTSGISVNSERTFISVAETTIGETTTSSSSSQTSVGEEPTGISAGHAQSGASLGEASASFTVDNTGSNEAVDIRPQYYALAYIIKL